MNTPDYRSFLLLSGAQSQLAGAWSLLAGAWRAVATPVSSSSLYLTKHSEHLGYPIDSLEQFPPTMKPPLDASCGVSSPEPNALVCVFPPLRILWHY